MGKNILIVMQDEYAALQLLQSLKEAGFYPRTSCDDSPDLIVLDAQYHGEGAVRTLNEVIAKFHASSIPVILLGSAPSGTVAHLLKKFGTTIGVRKPCEPPDVVEAIKTVLRRHDRGDT